MRLRVAADGGDPFVDYALDLAGGWLGHDLELAAPGDGPVDILHGDAGERPARLRIPRVARYTADDVPCPEPPRAGDPPPDDTLPFDLFAAMRFWLADEAHEDERDPASFDARGRLLARASAGARTGTLERPVVNAYLLHLRRHVEARLDAPARRALPAGRRCVVALSHDVDRPIDPRDPRTEIGLALRGALRGVRPAEAAENAARRVARSGIALATREGRHWLFDEVVAEEARRGFRSAFYFAATHRYARGGHANDVGYDLRSPRMRAVARSLRERGTEVGLHIGYLAGGDATAIARERAIAEEASGGPVAGARHHYFMPHPFWAALEAHGRAGLRYDTSVGFNEAPGYRLGIALPFRPFNPLTGRAVSCVQVPTFAMDAALFAAPGTDADAAVAHVERLVAALKAAEGVASLDWHDYSSYPGSRSHAAWGRAYLGVLDLLAADPEVAVLRPDEAAALAA